MQTLGDETGKIHFLELGNFFSGYYVEENKENELKSVAFQMSKLLSNQLHFNYINLSVQTI